MTPEASSTMEKTSIVEDHCLIAALGASAGGLEAFEKFFARMPVDAGFAFVIVQHLSPDHPSALSELVGRFTRMPVEQVRDNTKVLPNRVYIIPPNSTLTIKNHILRVATPAEPRGRRTPIDSLFTSLAEDCGEKAVCIVLSGTGTDGTLGLRAIKEHGGMALAQTIKSAKYDAILRSAIATGLVDHVLTVEEMPAKLLEYAAHLRLLNGKAHGTRRQLGSHLFRICEILRRRTGHDFSQYKENTVTRRLDRRMKALQIEDVEKYVKVLEDQPGETDRLFKDLLIGVTQFFRDPAAFDVLAREVIPKLFEGKAPSEQVRVCVVGCASGEEAYSIAILLCEHASTLNQPPEIQIFATDIDERGLDTARKGRYPAGVAENVSPERLERFFIKEEGSYQVSRALRQMCIFSNHSFLKDPPFSRLDLISCRNVLIYLEAALQQKLLPLFHYALRPGGYLFFGLSENVTSNPDLFRAIGKKHRIFLRRQSVSRPKVHFPITGFSPAGLASARPEETGDRIFPKQLERLLLDRYGPACVIVKESGEALYFSGQTNRYLQQPTGIPETNVVNMARPGLRVPLRTTLQRSAGAQERVMQKRISVERNGVISQVDLTVEPLKEFEQASLYMVVFEDAPEGTSAQTGAQSAISIDSEQTTRYLENELRSAQEQAQAAYEELETSNEELQSANEEYQSTIEELETSKEELQSFNEELETVNSELNRKVIELDQANSDLENLLNSTQIATMFLDSALRIKSFTPAAGSVFSLIPGDIGRPITDLAARFAGADFAGDIREVLKTLVPQERQLAAVDGRHFQMKILPYRTVHNVIDGVVVTFTNVTDLNKAVQLAEEAKVYAENILATVREPLLVLDAELRVKSANQSFYDTFHVTAGDSINRSLFELADGQWNSPELRRLMDEMLPQSKTVEDFKVTGDFRHAGRKSLLLNARQIDHVQLILMAVEDITERKQVEDALLRLNEELRHFAFAVAHDLQEPLRMVTSFTQLLSEEYKDKLSGEANQFIGYAVEGARRMETLLRELREYWSVNELKVHLAHPVDCNLMVGKALGYLDIAVKETCAVVTCGSLPVVQGNEIPLVTLFQNLIGNAIKYGRAGAPPQIRIFADRNGNTWTIGVADDGMGIERQHLDKIFIPFRRLHGPEIAGTGMGLAMCQKIVERFGGRIWAESEFGRGTTIRFTMPAAEAKAGA